MAWVSPLDHEPARDFLAGLAAVSRAELDALDEASRAQAFWIAEATDLRLVQDVLEQTGRGLVKGEPWGDFQEGLLQRLTNDWQGRVPNPPRRLELIVRNLGMRSYNTGRYRQMMTDGVRQARPFGLFDAIIDGRETPICKANNGLLLPLDDPAWQLRWPGLHHKCRSIVRSLSQAEASRRGGVTPPAERPGPEGEPQQGFGHAPGSRGEWEGMRLRPTDYDPDLWATAQAKGLTEVPEVPSRPLPPPQPWEDPANGMKRWERALHRRSWRPDTPTWLRDGIGRRGPLAKVVAKESKEASVYTWTDDAITLHHNDRLPLSGRAIEGVFRHEFGHALDHGPGRNPASRISARTAFLTAAQADRDRLAKRSPGRKSKRRARFDAEAADVRELGAAERQTRVAEALAAADLDEGQVRKLLDLESIAGSGTLSDAEVDALVWRFARAWRTDDVQSLIDLLDSPMGRLFETGQVADINPTLDRILSRGVFGKGRQVVDQQLDYLAHQTRVGPALSDLADALTHRRLRGSRVHETSYYALHPDLRGGEILANSVELLGSGPLGEDLVRKVAPDVLEDVRTLLLGGGP